MFTEIRESFRTATQPRRLAPVFMVVALYLAGSAGQASGINRSVVNAATEAARFTEAFAGNVWFNTKLETANRLNVTGDGIRAYGASVKDLARIIDPRPANRALNPATLGLNTPVRNAQ